MARYYLLDTFSHVPFKGNPTPICILDGELETETMARLAEEFNAPVTAFVESTTSNKRYKIRYFTSEGEIPACGHATLGAAFVLIDHDEVEFETIEKIMIKASRDGNNVYLEYPIYERTDCDISIELLEALNIEQKETHFYCPELKSLFIELKDSALVQRVCPDFEKLKKASDEIKEVVIMSESESKGTDFILRSFCPWIGIDEDPVTGSIHSVLGPFWKERTGNANLVAFQASKRTGQVFIKVLDNSIKIGGTSKILIEGQLKL